jgi:hypothetical protein
MARRPYTAMTSADARSSTEIKNERTGESATGHDVGCDVSSGESDDACKDVARTFGATEATMVATT